MPHGGKTGAVRLPRTDAASLRASTPSAATLKTPGVSLKDAVLEGVDHVVLVDELDPRIEAEHHGHGGQVEHPGERGIHVRAQDVRAAKDRDLHLGSLLGELRDGGLRLDDVALERGTRRMRPQHALVEEGGVVLLGAVVVSGALEDELAHG